MRRLSIFNRAGRAARANRKPFVEVQEGLHAIEVLNAVPEIVEKYAQDDEQAVLTAIRYNRLVDILTKVTCFHLQSHARTTIEGEGQIEIDDIYVGIDREGARYIIPLEAKSGGERDKLGWATIGSVSLSLMTTQIPRKLPLCRPGCMSCGERSIAIKQQSLEGGLEALRLLLSKTLQNGVTIRRRGKVCCIHGNARACECLLFAKFLRNEMKLWNPRMCIVEELRLLKNFNPT